MVSCLPNIMKTEVGLSLSSVCGRKLNFLDAQDEQKERLEADGQ